MKEEDYINATDLGKVTAIRQILREIMPEISTCIFPEEHAKVTRMVKFWETRLHKRINKDETEPEFFKNQVP